MRFMNTMRRSLVAVGAAGLLTASIGGPALAQDTTAQLTTYDAGFAGTGHPERDDDKDKRDKDKRDKDKHDKKDKEDKKDEKDKKDKGRDGFRGYGVHVQWS